MKHRFLIHPLNHTFPSVDLKEVSVPTKIVPSDGEVQLVPSLRFRAWTDVERHFRHLGGSAEAIESAKEDLEKVNAAVLTIV
jgi:hypothetical protein